MKQDEKIDNFESEVKKTYRRESDQEQIDAWVQEFKGAMEQRFADDEARDQEEIREEERENMNFNLVLSLTITLAFLVVSFIYRNSMMELSGQIKGYITKNFGWFFVLLSTGAVIYLAYLAFSRFGDDLLMLWRNF